MGSEMCIRDRPNLFGGLRNIFFKGPSGEMVELIEHFDESTRSKRL